MNTPPCIQEKRIFALKISWWPQGGGRGRGRRKHRLPCFQPSINADHDHPRGRPCGPAAAAAAWTLSLDCSRPGQPASEAMAASARLRQSKGAACARACATPSPTASCIATRRSCSASSAPRRVAGWWRAKGAGAVKWESDSDSDENNSDNEEDLMV